MAKIFELSLVERSLKKINVRRGIDLLIQDYESIQIDNPRLDHDMAELLVELRRLNVIQDSVITRFSNEILQAMK